ncbi:Rieske 2Fe-2S domain-containing protein [Mesorhizobium sp. INR15]|uniref:Rieske 2Fe-2S domain-containing protein n=1 Tax=Mesorhizobium sp. INR15 TaxID=2654248 RepID=UPI0018968204|nr:Rieske 2Fe-2S domain-containing protein [Mesorhizobium sp. INR15]
MENAWYCAAWSHELPRGGALLGRKLLNRHIALFRDSQGKPHAFNAVCPHRGADLSRGRVIGDRVECPMHGWVFDLDGQCVAVPSQPDDVKLPRACTPSYLTAESQGAIWIWVGAKRQGLPEPPCHDVWGEAPDRRRHFSKPQLWTCSFVNAVENLIDTTHVPFVHKSSLGGTRLYPRQKLVVDDDLRGFAGQDDPQSPWQRIEAAYAIGGLPGRVVTGLVGIGDIAGEHYRFDLGGSFYYQVDWRTGAWDVLLAHCTPADALHTWFFGLSVRTRATHWLGDLLQRWFDRRLCQEDEAEVTKMLSNDPELLPAPVSVAGDEPTLAFHRLYAYQLSRQDA